MRFEWDARKAETNRRSHGVTFEEVTSAFADPLSDTIADPLHSADEHRFVLIGHSFRRRLVVVAPTERGHTIHVISARAATRRERRAYEQESED